MPMREAEELTTARNGGEKINGAGRRQGAGAERRWGVAVISSRSTAAPNLKL
jgi:hypothetical protein